MKNPELVFYDAIITRGTKGNQITVGVKDRHHITEVIVGIVECNRGIRLNVVMLSIILLLTTGL